MGSEMCIRDRSKTMHHFFADPSQVAEDTVTITGPDVNHMKNVLRMKPGEALLVSDGTGNDYQCEIERLEADRAVVRICQAFCSQMELPSRIWLFQGLPKADKLEFIIQKAVELGAEAVVPVATKNAVVRLDEKKAQSKRKRWQSIAESAAKQSKRSRIPSVETVMSLKEAFGFIKEQGFDLCLIPYEQAQGMETMKEALAQVSSGQSIAVFIGPEGGFDESEIKLALEHGVRPVSLGKRILRTETAGLAILSALMMKLEGAF